MYTNESKELWLISNGYLNNESMFRTEGGTTSPKQKMFEVNEDKLNSLVGLSIMVGIMIGIMIMIILGAIVQSSSEDDLIMYKARIAELEVYEQQYHDAETKLATVNDEYHQLYDEYKDFTEVVGYTSDKLSTVLDKYQYILSLVPERSELTLHNLIEMDDLCAQANINPHLILSIFNTESGFDNNAKNSRSSATGLGQFVAGTGETFYSRLGYTGTYNHSTMATKPDLNIEMTVEYIKYLRDSYQNPTEMLNRYSGGGGASYYNKINSFMKHNTGYTVRDLDYA